MPARKDVWEFIRLEARQASRREPLLREVLEEVASAELDAQLLTRVLSSRPAACRLRAEDLRGLIDQAI